MVKRKLLSFILIILLIFTIPSTAFASTTPSFLNMRLSPMSLSLFDDLMPLAASSGTVLFGPNYYDRSSDTFYTMNNMVDGSVPVPSNTVKSLGTYSYTFNSGSPYAGFSVYLSDVSGSNAHGLEVTVNNILMRHRFSAALSSYLNLDSSLVSPVRSFVNFTATVNGRYTNPSTGSSSYSSQTFNGSSLVNVSSSCVYQPNLSSSYTLTYPLNSFVLSCDFDIPTSFSDFSNGVSVQYEVTSFTITDARLYVAFPVTNDSLLFSSTQLPISDSGWLTSDFHGLTDDYLFRGAYAFGLPPVSYKFTNLSNNGTSALSSQLNNVQQNISKLSLSVTKQITEVKQTVQEGANQVSNSITTQTTQISNKIDDIKTSVVNKVSEVKESVDEVNKSVIDIPKKIQEMILSLFIPDKDELAESFNSFSDLAESKLGIIWQVPEMVITFLGDFITALRNTDGTFLFPSFELDFMGDKLKLWDDYTVNMQPDGMEGLFTYVKLLTSIALLINFVNGLITLKDKFFERR